MTNINIVRTNNGTWAVKADTERFGKQEIMFESHSRRECVAYANEHGYQKQIKKMGVKLAAIRVLASKGLEVDSIKVVKHYKALGQDVYLLRAEIYHQGDAEINGRYNSIREVELAYYPGTDSICNANY